MNKNTEMMEQAIDKSMVTRAVISKIEEETKPNKIKAKHVKGYDSPAKISSKEKNEEYVPDITAFYDTTTTIYEIELKEELSVDKWRLLSLYAKKNNGNLFLVVPDYLKDNVKREIKDKDINAGIIYFNT